MEILPIAVKPIEKHRRSLAKSITYRTLSVVVDFTVAYLFFHDAPLAAAVVLVVNVYSTLLYYLHERIWAHIDWGRQPH
jgi:uncharacterized membrane protein